MNNNFEKLAKEINKLKKERNAVILAHNYQRDEVQEVADHCGDSLGLSQIAADSDADVIVFCGVHFMAESAAILAPQKRVLLPNIDAGCPMADMITAEALREKKKELPEGTQVVCYVNSSAEVKAESDICCTSGNVVSVVNSLPGDSVYMVPDMNLAKYAATKTDKKIDFWKGFCPTHQMVTAKEAEEVKARYPDAPLIVHPECRPEVLAIADEIKSTSGIYKFAEESKAKKIIIGTELGVIYRLQKLNPDKEFILLSKNLVCPNMKITTMEDLHDSLKEMKNTIKVEEPILSKAKIALERMLAVPRDN